MTESNIGRKKSQQILSSERKFQMPGLQTIALKSDLVLHSGRGAEVWDIDGNRYIDMFAGVGVCSVGHSHPRFIREVTRQLNKIIVGSFTTKVRSELMQLLASVTPEGLDQIQMYSGGSEAVEAALRLAKSYTKKCEFIAFTGGFHGKTLGALGLCGLNLREDYGPLPPGYHVFPYADRYHCLFCSEHSECDLSCVDFIRDKIQENQLENLAAIVVEPVQGTNGNTVPPPQFLPELKRLALEEEALLIVDEIITGFGRTGQMFVSDSDDICSDMIIIGKGMANGLPMSGIISNREIASAKPFANPSGSSSSFGGNPISATAALITLRIILEEHLLDNAHQVGAWLLHELRQFEDAYPFVGNTQGKGLLLGMELVEDKKSRNPLDKRITNEIFQRLLAKGVIMMAYDPKVRINPPLTISKELCEEVVEIMQDVFDSIANDFF